MLPWYFSEEAAVEKYMPQLQHNMSGRGRQGSGTIVMSPGGGKWVEIKTYADPLYQHHIVTAERKFWRWWRAVSHRDCSALSRQNRALRRSASVDINPSNAWAGTRRHLCPDPACPSGTR